MVQPKHERLPFLMPSSFLEGLPPIKFAKIWGAAILRDLGPGRADGLDLLEVLLGLLRAERGVELDRGLGAVAVTRAIIIIPIALTTPR